MYYQEKLTYVALALLTLAGCGAALAQVEEHCSEANVSMRSAAIAAPCEARKASECPKATYPNLADCPFMQRCIADLDAVEAECKGR
jgi:hypothetical protein